MITLTKQKKDSKIIPIIGNLAGIAVLIPIFFWLISHVHFNVELIYFFFAESVFFCILFALLGLIISIGNFIIYKKIQGESHENNHN